MTARLANADASQAGAPPRLPEGIVASAFGGFFYFFGFWGFFAPIRGSA
jgi:hypothetical protein